MKWKPCLFEASIVDEVCHVALWSHFSYLSFCIQVSSFRCKARQFLLLRSIHGHDLIYFRHVPFRLVFSQLNDQPIQPTYQPIHHSIQVLSSQFEQYVDRVKKTDCQAELGRLLKSGPPIYISDKHGFPLDDGDTHVTKLWFARDEREVPAKLRGAPEGDERQKLWDELNQFIVVEGKEEGDDDDDEKEGKGDQEQE